MSGSGGAREVVLGRRCCRTEVLRRILCSTMSESLLRLTTRCDISRNIEFARAIGEGDGDNDLDLSPDSAPAAVKRLMPLPVLNLRCMPVLVSRVGRSSPRRDARPRIREGDSPSVQCTLDLFP